MEKTGFNPYFNGYSTLTLLTLLIYTQRIQRFNPYFNGYSTLTGTTPLEKKS